MAKLAKTTAAAAATIMMTALGALVPAQAAGSAAGQSAARADTCNTVACCPQQAGPERRHCLLVTSQAYRTKLRGDEWVFTRAR